MTEENRHDRYFMKMAILASDLSTCARHHVGAVLVDPNRRILSTGRNGTKPGSPHCEDEMASGRLKYEDHSEWSKENELHAEVNAVNFCKQYNLPTGGARLFVTHSPCEECAKVLIKSDISEVIYLHEYDDAMDIWELFNRFGIKMRAFMDDLSEVKCKENLTLKEKCNAD